jgi:putative heme-binding domain-containing protein
LGAGGALSAALLCVAILAPELIHRSPPEAAPQADLNQLFVVPLDRPNEGTPLAEGTWVDAAKEAIRQGDVHIGVRAVKAGNLPGMASRIYLLINVTVHQLRPGPTIRFAGFGKERPGIVTDDAGRSYAFIGYQPRRYSPKFDEVPLNRDQWLIFEPPPPGVESLKLELPAAAWGRSGTCRFQIKGIVQEPPPDLVELVARYKQMLRTPPQRPADASLGRAVFARNCFECHTLHGVGGKTGPDLTASKRSDFDFLVTSVVNPSAEFAKGFEPWTVITTSGLIVHGIVKEKDAEGVTLQAQTMKVRVLHKDIEVMQPSKTSIMPTELLKNMDEHEIRSLFAYLSGPGQVPMLATHETVVFLSKHGEQLSGWTWSRPGWRVERGEIVAPGADGGVSPARLTSDLMLTSDFRLSLRFHVGKKGQGAVMIGGPFRPKVPVTGTRIEFAAGETIGLVPEGAPPVQAAEADRSLVQADTWNHLEIIAMKGGLRVRLNGKDVIAVDDARLPPRRFVTLEGCGISAQEIRFAGLELKLLPEKQPQ